MLKISDEAKSILTEMLAENDCDCLFVSLQPSCCGTSLDFSLTKKEAKDQPIIINGISVLIDEASKARTENVMLSTENGELVILGDTARSCC